MEMLRYAQHDEHNLLSLFCFYGVVSWYSNTCRSLLSVIDKR